jgi:serine/threonine-protein kinase
MDKTPAGPGSTRPPPGAVAGDDPGRTPAPAQATELQSTQAHEAAPPAINATVAQAQTEFGADDPERTRAPQETQAPMGDTRAVAAPAQAPPPPKEQKLSKLGDYRLLKKLGQGGMGTVYKAHQESLDRDVAVKVLFKHLAANTSFVDRFQREARIMAKLDHTNILRCFGVGEEHGYHYFAMEFIDGGSLQDWLDKLKQLSVGDAVHIALACARGLQHAHELNMIHRDIKPDNILITHKGGVKVADMGLAKAHGENLSLTRTGTAAGTPLYMSPEQARDAKHVDQRTDIYALGAMLYACIAGRPPIIAETYIELLEAKERGKFEPLRKSNDEVPERLDLMVDKMLAKRVESRYQTCAEIVTDLEGLGLASKTLSFLGAGTDSAAAAGTGSKTVTGSGAIPRKTVGGKTVPGGKTKALSSSGDDESNWWFVAFRGHDGKPVRRRMTNEQLREMIKEDDFDIKAQISRTLEGGYRSIGTFPEFESVLRGRITRMQADRKAQKFHNIYKKLEKEDISRRRWRWLRDLYTKAGGFVVFLIWMAIILAIIVGIYYGIRFGFSWVASHMEHLTQ